MGLAVDFWMSITGFVRGRSPRASTVIELRCMSSTIILTTTRCSGVVIEVAR